MKSKEIEVYETAFNLFFSGEGELGAKLIGNLAVEEVINESIAKELNISQESVVSLSLFYCNLIKLGILPEIIQ